MSKIKAKPKAKKTNSPSAAPSSQERQQALWINVRDALVLTNQVLEVVCERAQAGNKTAQALLDAALRRYQQKQIRAHLEQIL